MVVYNTGARDATLTVHRTLAPRRFPVTAVRAQRFWVIGDKPAGIGVRECRPAHAQRPLLRPAPFC